MEFGAGHFPKMIVQTIGLCFGFIGWLVVEYRESMVSSA